MELPDIKASAVVDMASIRVDVRVLTGALTIEATAGNRKKFKMLAYSGGKLALKEYEHPVIVDLSGMTIAAQIMPMLGEHNGKAGESESVTITANVLEIAGTIDAESDEGKLIVSASKGGFTWEASIGASVQAMEIYAAGETVTVNGQTFAGPVFVARKTTLKETSFVKRGADTGKTRVAIAAKESIAAYNENHDEMGRFSESDSSGGGEEISVSTTFHDTSNSPSPAPSKPETKQEPKESKPAGNFKVGDKVIFNGEKVTVIGHRTERDRLTNLMQKTGTYVRNSDGKESLIDHNRVLVKATFAAIAATQGDSAMDPKFEAYIKAASFDPATLTDPQKAALKAAFKAAEKAKEPPPVVPDPTIAAAADLLALREELKKDREERAEQARATEIAAKCVGHPQILAQAIKEKWTPDRAELEILRSNRPEIQIVTTDAGRTEIKASDCFEAALCISAGINEARVGKWFDSKVMNEAMSQRFRGARLSTIMFEVIRAAGMHTRMGAISDDTIRTALRADRKIRNAPPIRAEGFTTLSLSGILSNLANKRMIASYEAAMVVWPNFCAIRDHNDFKIHSRYRLDSTGSMRKVGPDGELKNISLQDATYTNQIDTYGGIIALTRQMQINDDMGAFLQIPDVFGRLARIRPEEAFFVLLLANATNFFAAGNKNLITGATGAMTAANGLAAITLAETLFSNQIDPNNKPILVPPDRMLTGTVNYVPARNIWLPNTPSPGKITGANQTEVANNEHVGKYQPYRSAFMNNTAVKDENGAAITGQSTTLWFLFADPAVRCAIAMAFLNGNVIPTIQSEDAEFDTLGMQWRCFFDFGVGYEDPVAAVQINGA